MDVGDFVRDGKCIEILYIYIFLYMPTNSIFMIITCSYIHTTTNRSGVFSNSIKMFSLWNFYWETALKHANIYFINYWQMLCNILQINLTIYLNRCTISWWDQQDRSTDGWARIKQHWGNSPLWYLANCIFTIFQIIRQYLNFDRTESGSSLPITTLVLLICRLQREYSRDDQTSHIPWLWLCVKPRKYFKTTVVYAVIVSPDKVGDT